MTVFYFVIMLFDQNFYYKFTFTVKNCKKTGIFAEYMKIFPTFAAVNPKRTLCGCISAARVAKWQTRWFQVPVELNPYRFESDLGHKKRICLSWHILFLFPEGSYCTGILAMRRQ